ncbi:Chimeric ERCC6-PGBD3 protein [Dissostichus eleginoides]|uniref:Chimeric ERCC6-PGBD3 protein n=1 Tax=Dissostichus eleginoides TaxID=100907 RepID=A0AAD9F9Y5_DISEL|nr:Chimeric ERCC6-PGBD3 protein [Dissostichus eleginoides]
MASTCTGQSPSDVAQRWSKKEKKMLNIQRPFSVKLYNQHMGGVDLMDQCVAMYPHRRKNKRIHQDTRKRKTQCHPTSKAQSSVQGTPEIRFGSGNHWPQLTEAKNANRCQDAACTRKTKYICMQCCVALCPGCFANYHGR